MLLLLLAPLVREMHLEMFRSQLRRSMQNSLALRKYLEQSLAEGLAAMAEDNLPRIYQLAAERLPREPSESWKSDQRTGTR